MGLWTDIKAKAVSWYNAPLLIKTAKDVGYYVYKTIQGLFQQASQAPDVVYAMIAHAPSRTVAKHVGQIFVRDVLPIGAVSYAWHLAEPVGLDYFFEDESGYGAQVAGVLVMGSLMVAKELFMIRNTIRHTIHSAVLTLESTKGLNERNQNRFDVCTSGPDVCTTKRYAQGAVRDTVTFYATEALLSGIGGSVASILSVYHHGDYITKLLLLGVCERHQVEYLKEHSELAFSIGIAHALATTSMTFMVERYTGIPVIYYQQFFSQAALLWLVSAGAHMLLPAAVKKSGRMIVDPVLFIQSAMGFATDTFLLGLKKQIPRMLAQPASNIPWAAIMKSLMAQWSTPWANHVKRIVLPSMLYSRRQFLQDPVINVYFDERRLSIIDILKQLEGFRETHTASILIAVVNSCKVTRDQTALLMKNFFGTPPEVAKLLIQIMASDFCMLKLQQLRHILEALHPSTPDKTINKDNDRGELRRDAIAIKSDDSLEEVVSLSHEQINDIFKQPVKCRPAAEILKSKTPASSLSAADVFKRTSASPANPMLFKKHPNTASSSSSSQHSPQDDSYAL